MGKIKFSNNGFSTLASGITAAATSLSIAAGHGVRFPSPTGTDYFLVVIVKASTGDKEVVKVSTRATDSFSVIVRAQEDIDGIAAVGVAFDAGDKIYITPTKAFYEAFALESTIQDGSTNYSAGGGAADVQTMATTPALTSYTNGMDMKWLPTANNTGSATINWDSKGAKTIQKMVSGTLTNLAAGDLDTDHVAHAIFNGTVAVLQNPKTGDAAQKDTGTTAGTLVLQENLLSQAAIAGEMRMYGGGAAPSGWVLCDGTAYDSVGDTSYADLYTAIGNTFGGTDGTDFKVPDLRGRSPIGVGTGDANNPTAWTLGEKPTSGAGGEEDHAQTISELVPHTHPTNAGASSEQSGAFNTLKNNPSTSGSTGGGQPFNITHPVLGVNFIIAK